jgi:hypothetical protein
MSADNVRQEEARDPCGLPWTPSPSRPVYLKDLELPPEVKQEVDDYCRRQGYRKASERAGAEQDAKLQYFFGGQTVGYKRTPQGLAIVVAGDLESKEFAAVLDPLPRSERTQITLYSPWKWNDDTGELGLLPDDLIDET